MMGKRGPAPSPTSLRVLRGDREDRINRNEPRPGEGEVRCPSWLSVKAKRVWRRLAPELVATGVLTSWDVDVFADLCELVVVNQAAMGDVAEHGTAITVVDRELADGTVVFRVTKNPNWQVARESTALLVTLGGRFGLTPSDRSQLKVGDGTSNGKRRGEDLLSGRS